MDLQTRVDTPQSQQLISHTDRVMLVGSCFTEHIGSHLLQSGFEVMQNPFGILYNPISVAQCIERCLDNHPIETANLVQHEGLWHSWFHHGSFSHADAQTCLDNCNQGMLQAHRFLGEGCTLIITFGTAYVFQLASNGQVVGNCHKLPPSTFQRRRLTIEEIVRVWSPLLHRLNKMGIRVVFTVSPIRHLADTAHGNQLSKSILLLAEDALTADAQNAEYFPAYEIVMDEMRDYRFYADDMVHPTPLAAEIVWQHFQQTYMSPATRNQCAVNYKQFRQSQHRSIHQQ